MGLDLKEARSIIYRMDIQDIFKLSGKEAADTVDRLSIKTIGA
jgi:hypothetical protein